jgi:hypothetical protein
MSEWELGLQARGAGWNRNLPGCGVGSRDLRSGEAGIKTRLSQATGVSWPGSRPAVASAINTTAPRRSTLRKPPLSLRR